MEWTWFPLVLLSAFCLGVYDLLKKSAVRDNSVSLVLFLATLSGSALYVLWAFSLGDFTRILFCTPFEYGMIWIKSFIVGFSWFCIYYSLQTLPISIAAPIRATSPFWGIIGAIILYIVVPTMIQAIGMLLIIAGYYRFSVLGHKEGLSFVKSKGMKLILLSALTGAMSGLYDKYLLNVLRIEPRIVQLHFSIDLVLLFAVLLVVRRFVGQPMPRLRWSWAIPLTGIFLILADFLYFKALSLPGIYIMQVSLVRRFSCVIAFVLGSLIFREQNIKDKALALFLVMAGVVILGLF